MFLCITCRKCTLSGAFSIIEKKITFTVHLISKIEVNYTILFNVNIGFLTGHPLLVRTRVLLLLVLPSGSRTSGC